MFLKGEEEKQMIDYLIGKKGHRQPLWVFFVVVFFYDYDFSGY
jgi:hypothetical protein